MSSAEATQQVRYEEVSYRTGAFPQTHPARLGAIARLFGLPAALPAQARVLELGCGCGLNLLPLAALLPGAQFVGMDLAAGEIAYGRQLAAAAGLTNVRLEAADVRKFAPEPGSYDYIIAHGVFSHVPDEAKAAILALCARALTPQGVAYISYNTYPGWKAREALRDLLHLRLRGVEGPAARLAAARATLAFLRTSLAEVTAPAAVALRALATDMEQKDPVVFFHDELEPFNDPCYLMQFVEWAEEHGLRYLGDAHFATMFPPPLSRDALAALATLAPAQVQAEQMLDYVCSRTFRSTLLVRAAAPIPLALSPAALRDCAFGSELRAAVAVPTLTEGHAIAYTHPSGLRINTGDPAAKALLSVLAAAWPRRLAYPEILTSTRRLLASASLAVPPDLDARLPVILLDLCSRSLLDFLLACGLDCATRPAASPEVDAVTRALAARGLNVANRYHEAVPLDPAARLLIPRLDGTAHSFTSEEQATLSRLAAQGMLKA